MARGPKKTPVEVLEARGSRVGRRRRAAMGGEVAPVVDVPAVVSYPPNLAEGARGYFDGVFAHLVKINRMNEVYTPGMVQLANLLHDIDAIREREKLLDEPGDMSVKEILMAATRIATQKKDAHNLARQLMDRFYMHPAAMEGLPLGGKGKDRKVQNENGTAPVERKL